MAIEPINAIAGRPTPNQVGNVLRGPTAGLQQSLLRIASGLRLTSPNIDPAGLAQSIQFESEISRIQAAQSNIANAVSFSQTQDSSLQSVQGSLDRIGELSIRAQDITLSDSDRASIQQEVNQLRESISQVSSQDFNGVPLFSSDDLQVTVDGDGGTATLQGVDLAASGAQGGLGDIIAGVSVATTGDAANALGSVQTATSNLASLRANVGANIQRLDVSGQNLSALSINLNAANGRIVGADLAIESVNLSQQQALVNTALVAFTNANRFPRAGISALA